MRLLILFCYLLISISPAYALTCRFETNPPGTSKFLWKPEAQNFTSKAVILPHQKYYSRKARVALYEASTEKLIEVAQIKSSGLCDGAAECENLKAYLTQVNGLAYRKKYRSLIVRVSERGKESRCFRIPRPGKRTQYRG